MPYTVHFDPTCGTLYSAVSGVLDCGDVAAWEAELYGAARSMPEGARFQVIDDLRGYEVAEQSTTVHKEMREVTPRFLAAHGFVVGFFKLYETAPPPKSEPRDCTRVVHLHHDENKMARYREVLGSDRENFFADADAARDWLAGD
jgi:hypothetical protein